MKVEDVRAYLDPHLSKRKDGIDKPQSKISKIESLKLLSQSENELVKEMKHEFPDIFMQRLERLGAQEAAKKRYRNRSYQSVDAQVDHQ